MSMERTTAADCRGKISYATNADANRAARRAQARQGGPKLEHFFCPHCQGFHIGRQNTAVSHAAKVRRRLRMQGAHGWSVSP